jgi:hypothetical protein
MGAGPVGLVARDLEPFQSAFAPGIGQTADQDQDENQHLDQRKNRAETLVRDRPRQQEDRLDIEDRKHQRIDVVLGLELHPRIAICLDPALVRFRLDRIGFSGGYQRGNDQRNR